MPTKKTPNPWFKAKRLLHEDYLNDFVQDDTSINEVYHLRSEYEACEFKKFKTNYTNLMKRIKKDEDRAVRDLVAYFHDIKLYEIAKYDDTQWHGSAAESFLKEDIQKGLIKEMKPKILYETREEYKKFELKVFRKHIYQETRNLRDSNYWLVKKKKKDKKKQAKREGEKYVDTDTNFYDPVLDKLF